LGKNYGAPKLRRTAGQYAEHAGAKLGAFADCAAMWKQRACARHKRSEGSGAVDAISDFHQTCGRSREARERAQTLQLLAMLARVQAGAARRQARMMLERARNVRRDLYQIVSEQPARRKVP
jgi:hypothetical protein